MAQCFFQNGTDVSDVSSQSYFACNTSNTQHSSCCPAGATCLTNGLCQTDDFAPPSNYYFRHGCTDKNFTDPACPNYCRGLADGIMWKCRDPETWACNVGGVPPHSERYKKENLKSCTVSSLVFKAPDPTPFTIAGRFTIVPSAAETTPTTGTSPSAGPGPTGSVTPDSSNNAALATGLGVGLGVGFALVVALMVFIIWRRKWSARQVGEAEQMVGAESDVEYKYEDGGDEISELPDPVAELPGASPEVEMGENDKTRVRVSRNEARDLES